MDELHAKETPLFLRPANVDRPVALACRTG